MSFNRHALKIIQLIDTNVYLCPEVPEYRKAFIQCSKIPPLNRYRLEKRFIISIIITIRLRRNLPGHSYSLSVDKKQILLFEQERESSIIPSAPAITQVVGMAGNKFPTHPKEYTKRIMKDQLAFLAV